MLNRTLPLLVCTLILSYATAQEAIAPRPSPVAIISNKYKDTYLKIVYGQPHKRGREVFGKLVPYGQVWRAGANEATEMTITRDVFVNGQLLAAGTYTLFVIPEKDKWKIIFNKDLGQWGSYNYNPKSDVMSFDVPTQQLPGELVYEPFTITIDSMNNKAAINLIWDKTKVTFNVDFIEPKP